MKLVNKPIRIAKTGKFTESSFGIRENDLPMMFDIVRNTMYSNKILAILREYSTNAVDAHIEAGKPNRPIEVTLPSNLNLMLEIRDFGLGLTEEEIRDVYVMYGASTKRESNAFTGQLGLGSKSAFCYTDSFMITSYVNGTVSTYRAYIDETRRGAIAKMSSSSTNEENGIKITIPVKVSDVNNFRREAERLFKYFSVTPIIKGNSVCISTPSYTYKGTGWGLTGSIYNSVAIMGNIGYPIHIHSLGDSITNNSQREFLESGVDIEFDIGDLEISSSRESLQYSKYTIDNIIKKVNFCIKELVDTVEDKIKNANNIIEAKKIRYDFIQGDLKSLRNVLNNNITWNNIKIDNSVLRNNYVNNNEVRMYELAKNNNNIPYARPIYHVTIDSKTEYEFFEDDVNGNKWIVRFSEGSKKYSHKDNIKFIAFRFKDDACKKKFISDQNLDSVKITPLSSIQLPKRKNKRTTTNSNKDIKTCYEYNPKSNSFYYSPYSQYWKKTSIDITKPNVYLRLNNYNPVVGNDKRISLSDLDYIFSTLKEAKINIDDIKWVGVKPNEYIHFKKWKTLDSILIERIIKYIESNYKHLFSHKYIECVRDQHLIDHTDKFFIHFISPKDVHHLDDDSIFKEYINRIDEIYKYTKKESIFNKLVNIAARLDFNIENYIESKVPKQKINPLTIRQLQNKVLEKYPVLKIIDRYYGYLSGSDKHNITEIVVKYVEEKEKYEKK